MTLTPRIRYLKYRVLGFFVGILKDRGLPFKFLASQISCHLTKALHLLSHKLLAKNGKEEFQ